MHSGYNNGARRSGPQGGRMMARGGAYGGGWGTPPPMEDEAPPSMWVAGYIRGPPTYPQQQFRGGYGGHRGGGHGGRGGRYGGGYIDDDDNDDEYEDGYGGGQGQLRQTQNPNFSGFEIGSNNRTDNGDNQVRLRFDLNKLKDIPERAGGVKIGSGQFAKEKGNVVDFSEYEDPAPPPPPPPQPQQRIGVGRIGHGYRRRS